MLKNIFEPQVKEIKQAQAVQEAELATQAQAEEEAKLVEEARQKESDLANLRGEISQVDNVILNFKSLLEKMQNSNEQASGAVGLALETKKDLTTQFNQLETQFNQLLENPDYRPVLEANGIHSIKDLLANEQYSQEEDIVNFDNQKQKKDEQYEITRSSIQERRNVKNEAIGAISQETGEEAKKMNYKDTVTALTELIKQLEDKRTELYHQIPEGEEALKAEIFEKIKLQHSKEAEKLELTDLNLSPNNHERVRTVSGSDIALAEEHGEDVVKSVVKDYYHQIIDEQLVEEAKAKGLTELQDAVDLIDNLPDRWQENSEKLEELEKEKSDALERMAKFFEDESILAEICKSYSISVADPRSIAKQILRLHHRDVFLIYYPQSGYDNESNIRMVIGEEREKIASGRYSLQHKKGSNLNLINPELIKRELEDQIKFFQTFQTDVGGEERVANFLYRHRRVQSDLLSEMREEERVSRDIKFSPSVTKLFKEKSPTEIWTDLQKEQKKQEELAEKLKSKIDYKIDADWAKNFSSRYAGNNSDDIRAIEKVLNMQKKAAELSPRLNILLSSLGEQMDQLVRYSGYKELGFESINSRDLDSLQDEIRSLKKELKAIEEEIKSIDDNADSEGNGLFGGKRKKREEEKRSLETKKQDIQSNLQTLEAEYQPKDEMRENMNNLNRLLNGGDNQSLLEGFNIQSPITLRDFVDGLKSHMNSYQLDPTKLQIYNRAKELKQEAKSSEDKLEIILQQ